MTETSAGGSTMQTTVKAFKAFNDDWTCRGFQFEIGKTYVHEGHPKICESGFHACMVPFDCWNYYHTNTFAAVELDGVANAAHEDSKCVGASITISAQITLPAWIKTQAQIVVDLCKTAAGALASKIKETAAATGDRGHAAATGDRGHAAATGDSGHAAATGYRGHAAATGTSGHAAATGTSGHAAATGDRGHAAATGDSGHAAATGTSGHAAATGYGGHAAATGTSGHAAATGYRGHAAATGYRGHAAVSGKNGIATSLGVSGTAKAEAGGAIVLAAYDDDWNLVAIRASRVGENGVEPGKTYRLTEDGEFSEVIL